LNGYYDRLESEANRFVDQEYTPILIRTALNGKSGELLMQKLETGKPEIKQLRMPSPLCNVFLRT